MWPLDRRPRGRECLRLGRLAAERWVGSEAGWLLLGREDIPAQVLDRPEALAASLPALYAHRPAEGGVTVVLESAWLPVLLGDTGGTLWGAAPLAAWMRHRLRLLHGSAEDDLAGWDIRVDAQAGERHALGYGLSPRVRQAVLAAAARSGLEVDALTPAISWGWQRLRPERTWPDRSGWWVWPEQDRCLVARVEAGRFVAFNAAAQLVTDPAQVERLIATEAVRLGLDAGAVDRIGVAAWRAPTQLPSPTPKQAWFALAGEASAAHAGAASSAMTGVSP